MVTNRLDFIAFLFCSHFIERLAVPTFKNYSTGEKRNNILTIKGILLLSTCVMNIHIKPMTLFLPQRAV